MNVSYLFGKMRDAERRFEYALRVQYGHLDDRFLSDDHNETTVAARNEYYDSLRLWHTAATTGLR